jgi:DNA (cytosine-5)-methyltransferase 1
MSEQNHLAVSKPTFLDFFAGSGLVTEALKSYFTPVWANDICEKKASVYCANHSKRVFRLAPIEEVTGHDVPPAILSWASFPCQDLSLAGNIEGIKSSRSGLVWQWLRVMDEMPGRPPLAVAENVAGLVSAAKGEHYRQLHMALIERGYKVGAVLIDAAHWVPQSRKRVFVIAVDRSLATSDLEENGPGWCHPPAVRRVADTLKDWVWWRLPEPPPRKIKLEDIIDFDAPCDDDEKTKRLLNLIPPKHRERLQTAMASGMKVFPGYKRIRNGRQVLELRFDGLAGCLRTPEGGSSRQFLVLCLNGKVQTRLLSVKEAAALMGVRKSYKIPGSYNDGYKAMGDAVAVPPVRYLARHLLVKLAVLAMKRECV